MLINTLIKVHFKKSIVLKNVRGQIYIYLFCVFVCVSFSVLIIASHFHGLFQELEDQSTMVAKNKQKIVFIFKKKFKFH